MRRIVRVASLGLLATFASSVLAVSEVLPSPTDADLESGSAGSAVAFVYVSSQKGRTFEVNAYRAAANGELTPVSGSPFADNSSSLATNGTYLFGTNGVEIFSYAIASDGGLTQVGSINAEGYNEDSCGGPESLFVDRTGSYLYDPDLLGNICANNAYQSFGIDNLTGALTYLGAAVASPGYNTPLSFIGDNIYGYSSTCYRYDASIFGYARDNGGTLTQSTISGGALPTPPAGDFYCAFSSAADSTNHIAIPLMPMNDSSWQQDGPLQIAVYTADSSGNLSTTSTDANMAQSPAGSVTDIRISPSGKYLAVAGTSGLQVFHFNGADPVTPFSGLLVSTEVDHILWDNADHLYAISTSAGKMAVFSVTATKVTLAPGSPYTVVSPQGIAVLTK